MLNRITALFPLWALLGAIFAYVQPELLISFKGYIVPLLIIIMLSMGLTLSFRDFTNVLTYKYAVGAGVLLQFTIMPLVALMISIFMGLDESLMIGMVLVGTVAGGTASNVVCYLAKGDVALSITMTATSTLLGVVLTPLLAELLIGQKVDIPMAVMIWSLVKIVLLPVSIGLLINQLIGSKITRITPILPLISMLSIVTAIMIIVALNAKQFAQLGPLIALAVVLHNSIGLLLGYICCRLMGFNKTICRTISLEVGLQNSGLATALAMKFFTPLAALPAAIFSVWHNLSGALLAGYWSQREETPPTPCNDKG
ncbi:bile acid:sodium symporter family protein [Moritella sp. 5]|uniref:bile acid:sodium symporter family protein n=1 Tax=Moritella sp. 5 TaxID=2746231 RepID=UPI001BABB2AE|nr:bile acid:sodium symporter family protein [Moritella sp. 5]QUM80777.1 bile acid:sodium symporter family protein [Moritella sp. 5]